MKKKTTYKLTESCRTLTLSRFIECLYNKRYEVLIEKGTNVPSEVLQTAWDTIWSEYIELQGDDNLTMLLNALRDYNYNRAALASIEIALFVLEIAYNKECADNLRKYGFSYNFETENKEDYQRYLKTSKTRSKGFHISAERAKESYLQLTGESREMVARQIDFDEVLAATSKYMGYQVNPETTTVVQFIAMQKLMKK